jgi:hypothetical protein
MVLAVIAFWQADRRAAGLKNVADLAGIDQLQTAFNQDAGTPRLILLLSPTWATCLAGARWVQNNILQKYPSADLKVYVIWVPMLAFDARMSIDASVISDSRVEQFWDGDKVAGAWFAEELEGYPGVAWDVYYLYGPDAKWDSTPEPLISSGETVIGSSAALKNALLPFLK